MARVMSDIYLKKYPNDNRISDCLDATEKFLDAKITLEDFNVFRTKCWDARRSDAADAAAYAADADATKSSQKTYAQKLEDALIEFVNKQS